MSEVVPDRLSRRVFEVGLALAACLQSLGPIWNEDLFWHLASGRYFLGTHRLPSVDPFTFTATRAWVRDEWLSEIVLALVDQLAGFRGLRIAAGLLVAATVLLLARALRRLETPALPACLLLLLVWVATAPNASARPHLFGWVLAVAVVGELLLRAPPWSRWHWLVLFALAFLWANLHPSAVILPAMAAAHLVGLVVEPRLLPAKQSGGAPTPAAGLRHWAAVFAVSAAACLVQPSGLGFFRQIAETPGINRQSGEWIPLLGGDTLAARPESIVAWALIAGTVALLGLGWHRRSAGFPNLVAAVAFVTLAATARRMTFFLFVPALYIARGVAEREFDREFLRPALRRGLAWVLVGAVIALALAGLPRALDPHPIAPGLVPVRATELLRRADLEGRIFNPPDWGGYIEYMLYPQYRTFMDGRWVLAGRQVVDDQERIVLRSPGYREALDRYGIEILLEPLHFYLAAPALAPEEWRLAFQDEFTVVLLRDGEHLPENLRRLCALYRASPGLRRRARWSFTETPAEGGLPSHTDIAPAVLACDGEPAEVEAPPLPGVG